MKECVISGIVPPSASQGMYPYTAVRHHFRIDKAAYGLIEGAGGHAAYSIIGNYTIYEYSPLMLRVEACGVTGIPVGGERIVFWITASILKNNTNLLKQSIINPLQAQTRWSPDGYSEHILKGITTIQLLIL